MPYRKCKRVEYVVVVKRMMRKSKVYEHINTIRDNIHTHILYSVHFREKRMHGLDIALYACLLGVVKLLVLCHNYPASRHIQKNKRGEMKTENDK